MLKPSVERIALLNRGEEEARNLMETLAIDFSQLLAHTLPSFKMPLLPSPLGITKKMHLVAEAIYYQLGLDVFSFLSTHSSDTLRGLSCYLLKQAPFSFAQKMNAIHLLADDPNPGVREWAWLALRPDIILNPEEGISLLEKWTTHPSPRIRRYACEMTRPRGVWCAHFPLLKQYPEKALNLLSSLNNDPERYVQLSVGNWLSDAGKDHPQWVVNLCHQWLESSPTLPTRKICKRALRHIGLNGFEKYYS